MVRNRNEEGERERVSWREIDRRKDRSRHAPQEAPVEHQRSRRSEWIMKKYRKEADRLFMGKQGTKKHQKAREDIDRHHGTEKFEETVRHYLDQYGLPDDWRTLSFILDYSDPEKILETIHAMKVLYETRTPMEKQAFKARLDILAMTTPHSDLRDVAEEILKTL